MQCLGIKEKDSKKLTWIETELRPVVGTSVFLEADSENKELKVLGISEIEPVMRKTYFGPKSKLQVIEQLSNKGEEGTLKWEKQEDVGTLSDEELSRKEKKRERKQRYRAQRKQNVQKKEWNISIIKKE